MQQLSGSSGFGGTKTPATNLLFFCISDRRSKGEESREEKRMLGSGSGVEVMGGFEGDAVVGGALDMGEGEAGEDEDEDSRIEA